MNDETPTAPVSAAPMTPPRPRLNSILAGLLGLASALNLGRVPAMRSRSAGGARMAGPAKASRKVAVIHQIRGAMKRREAHFQACRTAYTAKMALVKDGKGKNSPEGIPDWWKAEQAPTQEAGL